jgi:hypothetical protein
MKKKENPFAPVVNFKPTVDFKPVNLFANFKPEKKRESCHNLTQKQISSIKRIAQKCEIKGCSLDPHDVHHIKFCEEGGTDSYGNLIALCGGHHDETHGKGLSGIRTPKAKLYGIVERRAKDKAKAIKDILENLEKARKKRAKKEPKSTNMWGI